jgi:hypothetical protein
LGRFSVQYLAFIFDEGVRSGTAGICQAAIKPPANAATGKTQVALTAFGDSIPARLMAPITFLEGVLGRKRIGGGLTGPVVRHVFPT